MRLSEESILKTVRMVCGLDQNDTSFDADLIMHTNTVFMILAQLGVGPINGFMITDESTTWDSYNSGLQNMQAVKTYVGTKVRFIFDPPTSSAVSASIESVIKELEWRLMSEKEINDVT